MTRNKKNAFSMSDFGDNEPDRRKPLFQSDSDPKIQGNQNEIKITFDLESDQ